MRAKLFLMLAGEREGARALEQVLMRESCSQGTDNWELIG